jgi:16S rRNA (uracil1498-N3)-methyltransferase
MKQEKASRIVSKTSSPGLRTDAVLAFHTPCMTRIFIETTVREMSSLELTGEKSHYLSTVLRFSPGSKLSVIDSSGSAYLAYIVSVSKKNAVLQIGERCAPAPESPLDITLIQGLLKGEKMEFIIQKASELGVRQLFPVITERSQIRETRKLPRWKKIAEESSRQCGRAAVTRVLEPRNLKDVIYSFDNSSIAGIIFWEHADLPFSSSLEKCKGKKQIILLTGPEGGFSEEEVCSAAKKGFHVTCMGKRILRAETAAIAAVSVTQYVLGDLSGRS